MPGDNERQQVRTTRGALLGAFNALLHEEQRYNDIRVGEILRKSEVGRSTFYEHFRDKDDLLIHSMAGIIEVLASTLDEQCDLLHLEHLLEHFRENIVLVRGLLKGPSYPHVVRELARMMEKRLPSEINSTLPSSLIATQMAEAQSGLIGAWLNGGAASTARSVAEALQRSGVALKSAYAATCH